MSEEKNVLVERYKVISDIELKDGFVLCDGAEVRRVLESAEVDDKINVVFCSDFEVKRILWVDKHNLELTSSGIEVWTKSEYDKEMKDKDEKWFD